MREPLSTIRLTFTQAVDGRYAAVSLLDASGQEISIGTLAPVGNSPSKEYTLTFAQPLVAGAFTVKWKAVSADGHAVTGSFDFVVDVPDAISNLQAPTATLAPDAAHPEEHGGHHAGAADIPRLYRADTSLAWIFARWLNFFALLLVVGAVAFRFGVVERALTQINDELFALRADDATRRIAVVAASALIVSGLLRLWLQSGSVHGPERMFQGEYLSALIFKGGWGKAWLAQMVAGVGFLIAVAIKTADRGDSWLSAAAFAVVAAATPAFAGHAAAVEQMAIVPILDDAIHVITASAWLGSLAFLLMAGLPAALRSENGVAKAATLVHTFSPFALVMAGIAVFTGALNAFVHINAFSEFWTTPYGRILALKIGLVIIAMTMGAYNWRVVRPRLGSAEATAHLKKSASSELAMSVLIILITAVLVGTPTN